MAEDKKKKDFCGMNTKTSQFPKNVLMERVIKKYLPRKLAFWGPFSNFRSNIWNAWHKSQ